MKYAGPLNIFSMASKYGGIHPARYGTLLLHLLRYFVNLPLYLLSTLYYNKVRSVQLPSDPLIILGHFRTGTSFMQRLLGRDTQFSYVTNMEVLYPYLPKPLYRVLRAYNDRLARTFRIKYQHLNNVQVKMDDPMEEELALIYQFYPVSAYWGYVFPNASDLMGSMTFLEDADKRRRWKKDFVFLLKRTLLTRGKRRLLLKSPPNTGRIPILLELFPNARFIYMDRDPYHVYKSMVKMMSNVHGHYGLQIPNIDHSEIISHYEKLTRSYQEYKKLIPPGNLIEIDFNAFVNQPIETVKNIYQKFGYAISGEALMGFLEYLDDSQSYKHSTYDDEIMDRDTFQRLLSIEGEFSESHNIKH